MKEHEEKQDILRFVVKDAFVLAGYATDLGQGWATLIQGAALTEEALDLALQQIQGHVLVPPAHLEFKLVGPSRGLPTAAMLMQQRGLTLKATAARDALAEVNFHRRSGRLRVEKENKAASPLAEPNRRIRVLIVDDSETMRRLLRRILGDAVDLEIMESGGKPSEVESLLREYKPDVMTLDIHMPEMNGVELLKRFLPKHPIPVIMISALSLEDGPLVLSALEAGAVDYIQKPTVALLPTVGPLIIDRIRAVARAKVQVQNPAALSKGRMSSVLFDATSCIAIGSSTGGTEALRQILTQLPEHIPPIVIVQHIPPVFSGAFARRLHDLCPFEVKEAEDGDCVCADRVLIAPGGKQMKLIRAGAEVKVQIDDAPPRNLHKPSVDYLFESVAQVMGEKAMGLILTGMGADGAVGLLQMRKAGALTIAQDESSCVVFGMPRKAIEMGAAQETLSLDRMAEAIISRVPVKQRR